MKTNSLLIGLSLLALLSCNKDDKGQSGDDPNALVVVTSSAKNVKQTSAECGGTVTAGSSRVISDKGICWNTTGSPKVTDSKSSSGAGAGEITGTVSGLTYNTKYFVRTYVVSGAETVYGSESSFTTQAISVKGGGVTDVQGNSYATVVLADKEWMAENLRTTKYRNGEVIPNPNTITNLAWGSLSTPAWCNYNNTTGYDATYGKLYNYYALTDSRQVCPTGWHVPSMGEWTVLAMYLGTDPGGKMKQTGVGNWASPNTGATNISGFNGLPSGYRTASTTGFVDFGVNGMLWTSELPTSGGNYGVKFVNLSYNSTDITSSTTYKASGVSVRCIKD